MQKSPDALLPNIRGLVDPKVETEIYRAFRRVYEYFEDKLNKQESVIRSAIKAEQEQTRKDLDEVSNLVSGIFAVPLIGTSNQVNPLQTLGVGDGTVKNVTAGNGLSGGAITETGTIALIIGTLNKLQKSNGTQLVNSSITDDGNNVAILADTLIEFGSVTIISIDVNNGLVILNPIFLPTSDPLVSGALWNNLGVINVSP